MADEQITLGSLQQQELEIWRRWKAMGEPEYGVEFELLVNGLLPALMKQYGSYGRMNVSPVALEAKLLHILVRSLHTYDASRGAQLNTHIVSQGRQVGRWARQNTNIARLPDDRAQLVTLFKNVRDNLRTSLGRDPNAAELADELGWNIGRVEMISKEIRNEINMTDTLGALSPGSGINVMDKINYVYYDLNPEEKVVLEHTYGLHGKPNLAGDVNKISAATGLTSKAIYKAKKTIYEKLKVILQE